MKCVPETDLRGQRTAEWVEYTETPTPTPTPVPLYKPLSDTIFYEAEPSAGSECETAYKVLKERNERLEVDMMGLCACPYYDED